jgi:uncharacterized phage protein (TIGR01671 family)
MQHDIAVARGKATVNYEDDGPCEEDDCPVDDLVHEHHNWPLMQYTGLKDKNGKEIYEGDIVRALRPKYGPGRRRLDRAASSYDELILECIYDSERAGFLFRNNKMGWSAAFAMEHNYEILGNIYENPDLLKATT